MFEISIWLSPLAKQSETIRYIQQGTYVFAAILAVIAILSLRKLLPKTLRRAVLDKFLYAMKKMASNISGISKKILSFLGFKFDRFKRGRDEKSFIFGEDDEETRKKKRHSVKASSKWKDMEDNAEKIRFLYIKYIVKVIKGGYKFRTALTPNEVKDDLDFDDGQPDKELFDLYYGARYSGGSVYITDEQVAFAQDIVNNRKK
jgi:hypothetical protein